MLGRLVQSLFLFKSILVKLQTKNTVNTNIYIYNRQSLEELLKIIPINIEINIQPTCYLTSNTYLSTLI